MMGLSNGRTTLELACAALSDIPAILDLDAKVYAPQWQVTDAYVYRILDINPETYRVVRVHGHVKGYYALLPLREPGFSRYLEGSIGDEECIDYVVPFQSNVTCSLIFNSIVVDPFDVNANSVAQRLLLDLRPTLHKILTAGVRLQQIGCITVSKEGERMARVLGLRRKGNLRHHHSPSTEQPGIVYSNSFENLREHKFWSRKCMSTQGTSGDLSLCVLSDLAMLTDVA